MFYKSFHIYDAIYASLGKDYARESARVDELIRAYKRSPGNRLLDVACGTGRHLTYLKDSYQAEGIDLEPGMLEIARQRNPGMDFHLGDMTDFDLGSRFDAVICLFSAIGYVRTLAGLHSAISAMARHLVPGGVLIVEPWLDPDVFRPGLVHAHYVDEPDLKIARINTSNVRDGVSILDMHYLVGTPDGVDYFSELHEVGLFSREEYKTAFVESGLSYDRDEEGLIGRGLLIGVKP
jgi:SAM-dependent methyltransferase